MTWPSFPSCHLCHLTRRSIFTPRRHLMPCKPTARGKRTTAIERVVTAATATFAQTAENKRHRARTNQTRGQYNTDTPRMDRHKRTWANTPIPRKKPHVTTDHLPDCEHPSRRAEPPRSISTHHDAQAPQATTEPSSFTAEPSEPPGQPPARQVKRGQHQPE